MTLTQVAILTRRFIVLFIVLFVLGIASFVGYRIWYANYLASLPPIEIKADANWGVLPTPQFANTTTVSSANFSYSVDTVTGNLPTFDKLAKVFFMPKSVATLLSADRSRNIADNLKLSNEPEILSPTIYEYKDNGKQLLVDLDSGNFIYTLEATPAAKELMEDTEATIIQSFKTLLSSMDLLNDELKDGPSKVVYLKYQDSEQGSADRKLVSAGSFSTAEAAEIYIWPKNLEDKPILTIPYSQSLIKAVVRKSAKDPDNYLLLNVTYWPIDTSSFSTYPLKTADQALADLKAGQGIVTIAPENPNISITSLTLAYFQSDQYTPYLQPIYVFEGPGFVAYVPAITTQYLSTANNTEANP